MDKPSLLILGAEPDAESRFVLALRDIARVVGSGTSAEPAACVDAYRRLKPGAVIVVVSFDPEASFRLVSEISALGGRVLVVSPVKDSDLILQAMRAGAREFVIDDDPEELRRAVRAQALPPDDTSGLGSVITLFPAKGGVGATAIAVNLAGVLERSGLRVCLLDVDLFLGDVLSFLDLPGTYSITDVISNMRRLDRELLDSSVSRHPSGVRVLAQSGKIEEAEHIRAPDITSLIAFLRRFYDMVVIDGARGFDEISLAALDASRHILMVLTQDVPAVRNAQRCLDVFHRLGYQGDRLHLVLNRYQKGSKITTEVVNDTLGVPVSHVVANDFVSLIDAINRGVLLTEAAPRSKLTKDIEELAPLVAGARKDNVRRAGFLRGLLSGKPADETPRTPDQS